ncbi:acetyl-CoA acetyltransferase 2 isoform X2 [Corylus avellana]|uniref:acetyl-CoA acetyltransferase 2 isoform X1 n=2 Tax=Corylus avellana TaxID=13451 RepID=UPI001E23966D|nr:acetyl-CoA acetyltransferase 2 isoform X1 [Corylus avellana]XP_059437218.1 acetyl-CoA acetyltransferase 2 isoform X2 [Corylus avellana]
MASSDSIKPRDVCIVGVARTPMGGLLGTLSSLSATKLGSIAIECALKRANVDPSLVQEVFFGNVLSANLGQAPARQAALGAGIPTSVICTTINKVCSSGMKATMLAAQSIQLGLNDVVVAGGMESMSNAPKYLAEARKGSRFGHDTIVDGMLKDGLWDVYNDFGMGVCAEICANQHTITREEQDNYAIRSFERGISAQNGGHFAWEIVPVEIYGGRGKPSIIVDKDEGLGKFDAAKLRKLKPSFKEDGGSVTAGNASSISDGAAALVLVSGEKALQLGLQVIAKIKGFADAAQAPELFPTAPALAIPKAISNAGLEASQIDYFEINEAFSVVALANQKLLSLNPEKVNAHGGAVSLGHPLGCSGARILVTLLGVLRHKNGKYGVGGICNGGGGASALVLELMPVTRVGHSRL